MSADPSKPGNGVQPPAPGPAAGTTAAGGAGAAAGDSSAAGEALRGPDLVRAALSQAKAAARAKGVTPGNRPRRRPGGSRSGAGPDARDPVRFGAAIQRLIAERGWEDTTAAASVLGRWDVLVGPEVSEHCQPVSLVDGELVLTAESSAWATQLRLLTRTLQARLEEQLGAGVVTRIVVLGPAQPDWRKGPLRVRGRGPRDTFG